MGSRCGPTDCATTPDEPGIPLTRIEPRALLVPPGFPDFMTRRRVVRSGAVEIEGRAWSGWAPVSTVEVSIDGGDTWEPADVEAPQDRHGWARWNGTGTPSLAATCCPAEQPMPAAGRNRVGNGGVAVDLPTTPSNGSLSLSSVQKCDSRPALGRRRPTGGRRVHLPLRWVRGE